MKTFSPALNFVLLMFAKHTGLSKQETEKLMGWAEMFLVPQASRKIVDAHTEPVALLHILDERNEDGTTSAGQAIFMSEQCIIEIAQMCHNLSGTVTWDAIRKATYYIWLDSQMEKPYMIAIYSQTMEKWVDIADQGFPFNNLAMDKIASHCEETLSLD